MGRGLGEQPNGHSNLLTCTSNAHNKPSAQYKRIYLSAVIPRSLRILPHHLSRDTLEAYKH